VWNRCAQRKVGFPTGVSLFLIGELLAALAYAHRAGGLSLVHRDVSPSNVMVAYTGGVKVIDFGLAKWRAKVSETAAGINWGKLNYMSPEQHHGKTVDHRSDLFSAGVIIWELLTGRQLFPNAKARAELREIPPPSRFNSSVTPGLDLVVLKALRTSPGDRFLNGEQMAAALAAETPRNSSKRQLADFIERLFSTDRLAEEAEQQALLARVAELGEDMPVGLSSTSGANANDPLVGTVLAERYYVKRLVGQGAMGRVYEGHHTGVGKRVAIKIPRHAERRKAALLQRFKREAQAASQIGHVNIADVTDCGTTPGGDFFFVMEFIDGVDLEKLIKRDGAVPLERVLVIGLQIARALEAAHQAGIIHRDLKPSNVMLVRGREEADLAKVLDFGVAKFLRGDTGGAQVGPVPELTQHDAAVGTPRYMAPEQIGAGREIDFRADIYALGGVLYFMLSGGRAPVEGDTVEKVWQRKLNDDPTPLPDHRPDVPEELELLVMRCLARDPAQRPPSMTALKAALVASLEKVRSMESALLPARAQSQTEVAANRRWGVALGSAAAALLVVTAAAVIWRARMDVIDPPAAARESAPDLPATALTSGSAANEREHQPPPALRSPVVAAPPAEPRRPEPRESSPLAPAPDRRLARKLPPAVQRPPVAPAGLLERGEALFDKGDFVDAETVATKAVRAEGSLRAYLLLGKIQLETEQFDEAAASYTQALRLDRGNTTALHGLEKARAAQSRPQR
jgi:serine/threonine protein kinase